MRLLHTSDWHLGRTLHGLDILDIQRDALGQIVSIAEREQVDAVVVSGDIYDRAVPPVDAVALLADTLKRLASMCHVIVSSGNHDSAVRLGFGSELFTDRLHVRTRVDRIADPVLLSDEFGPVLVYPLPYLDPETVRHRLGPEPVHRTHEAVVGAALDLVRTDLSNRERESGSLLRSVVMAHAFVANSPTSAERSESERDIRVGGIEIVPSILFEGFTYTAMGHLHGPQEPALDGPGRVRYSGSPLRYSFSEAGQDKSVTIVDIGPDDIKDVWTVPIRQPRPMVEVRGSFAELLGDHVPQRNRDAWVKAVVTDAIRPDHMIAKLKQQFPHLLSAHHEPDVPDAPHRLDGVDAMDPLEILIQFVCKASGSEPGDDEVRILREVYEHVRREEVSDR